MVTSINPFGNLDEDLAKKKKRPTGIFTESGAEFEAPADVNQRKSAEITRQKADILLAGTADADTAGLTREQATRIAAPLEAGAELPPRPTEQPVGAPTLTPEQQAFQADAIARAQQAAIPKSELAPPEPEITALTTSAELREMVEKKTPLSEWQRQQLAGVIRGSNSPAVKASAQATLRKAGETRTVGEIAGQPAALREAIEFRAEVSPTSISSAERKQIAQDEARELAVKTAERDKLWEREKTDFNETMRQQKLGIGEERLKGYRLDNISKEAERVREAALDKALGITNIEPQETTKTKNEVTSAATVGNIKKTTWPQMLNLTTRYNVAPELRDKLQLGVYASSYTTPVELAKDIDVDVPDQDAYAIKESNVIKHTQAIRDAIDQNITPDDATKQILEESDIGPPDKNYAQTALDISYGVLSEYTKAGNESLADVKTTIAQSEAISRDETIRQLVPLAEELAEPEGVRMITAELQQSLTRMKTARAAGTTYAPFAPGFEAEARATAGLPGEVPTEMSREQIQTKYILPALANRFRNDPTMVAYIADQIQRVGNGNALDPAIQPFMDAAIGSFAKGAESLRVEEEKEEMKREKVKEDNLKKRNIITVYGADGKPKNFRNTEEGHAASILYVELSDYGQGILVASEDAKIQAIVGKEARDDKRKTTLEGQISVLENRKDKNQKYFEKLVADGVEGYAVNITKNMVARDQQKIEAKQRELDGLSLGETAPVEEPPDAINEVLPTAPEPEADPVKITTPTIPVAGEIRNGYRFKEGGDHTKSSGWEKVIPPGAEASELAVDLASTVLSPEVAPPAVASETKPAPTKPTDEKLLAPATEPKTATQIEHERSLTEREQEMRDRFSGKTAAKEKVQEEKEQREFDDTKRKVAFSELTEGATLNPEVPPEYGVEDAMKMRKLFSEKFGVYMSVTGIERALEKRGYSPRQINQLINAQLSK